MHATVQQGTVLRCMQGPCNKNRPLLHGPHLHLVEGGYFVKKYNFTILIEKDEDEGYIATVPELIGCHTQGDTIAEIMANVDEAIKLCLDAHAKDGIQVFNPNFIESKQFELVI